MVISLSKLRGNCFGSQKFQSSKPKKVFMLEPPSHIVRLTIWYHLLLEFWLVDTWFFAQWRQQRAVTCLENVRQLNIRRDKKLGFQLSHRQPLHGKIFFQKTSSAPRFSVKYALKKLKGATFNYLYGLHLVPVIRIYFNKSLIYLEVKAARILVK